MAAVGDHNSEEVRSSSVANEMQQRNESTSGDDVTSCSSSSSKTPSPSFLDRVLFPLSNPTVKRGSQSMDGSISLQYGIHEKKGIGEESSSSAAQFDSKCALLSSFTSAKHLYMLHERLAVMRDEAYQAAVPILADHSAVAPFMRTNLMLLSSNDRDEGTNGHTDVYCLSTAKMMKWKNSDYQDRHRKNNNATRRSREARRTKETLNRNLEEENSGLRLQIDALRGRLNHMQLMLMTSKAATASYKDFDG